MPISTRLNAECCRIFHCQHEATMSVRFVCMEPGVRLFDICLFLFILECLYWSKNMQSLIVLYRTVSHIWSIEIMCKHFCFEIIIKFIWVEPPVLCSVHMHLPLLFWEITQYFRGKRLLAIYPRFPKNNFRKSMFSRCIYWGVEGGVNYIRIFAISGPARSLFPAAIGHPLDQKWSTCSYLYSTVIENLSACSRTC